MRVSRIDLKPACFQPRFHLGKGLRMIMRGRIHVEGVEPDPFPKIAFTQRQPLKVSGGDRQHSHHDLPNDSALPAPRVIGQKNFSNEVANASVRSKIPSPVNGRNRYLNPTVPMNAFQLRS